MPTVTLSQNTRTGRYLVRADWPNGSTVAANFGSEADARRYADATAGATPFAALEWLADAQQRKD